MPKHYRLFGLRVLSEITLGQLPTRRFKLPDVHLVLGKSVRPKGSRISFYHRIYSDQGSLASSFAWSGKKFLVRLHGVADFMISQNGSQIECFPVPKSELADVAALFISQIMPLAMSLRKNLLVMHACGVRIGHGCAIILGNQGFGKSTLAAAFVRRGYSLLSDDVLPLRRKLNQLQALPGVPEIRLGSKMVDLIGGDSRINGLTKVFAKTRVGVGFAFCSEPLPVKKIYWLSPPKRTDRSLSITPLSLKDGWQALLQNCFRLDIQNSSRVREEFHLLGQVMENGAVRKLSFARRKDFLDEVVKGIVNDFRA